MKRIKIFITLFVCFLIVSLFFHYKSSYYGYTKSYFLQTPKYIRPHFRGAGQGHRGFCFVQYDFDLTVLGTTHKTYFNDDKNFRLKHISGYYYNEKNILVEAIDDQNTPHLIFMDNENYKKRSYDLLNSVPKDENYKHIVASEGRIIHTTTNLLKIATLILGFSSLYLIIKERKRKKKR